MISNSTTSLPPNSAGTYAYSTWRPGAASFPAIGSTYTDPVFGASDPTGSEVRRLTDQGSSSSNSFCYAHHWSNADGTLFFDDHTSNLRIRSTTSPASPLFSSQDAGDEPGTIQWHPTEPLKYQRFEGASLVERTLSGTPSDVTVKVFPGTLQDVGQSLPWVDGTGDFYVVKWGGIVRVWRRSTNATYSGTITPLGGGGYTTMSPDGNYVIDVGGGTFRAYPLNHGTATIGAAVVCLDSTWNGGDHAAVVSATNGVTYVVSGTSEPNGEVYAFSVTVDRSSMTLAQLKASAVFCFDVDQNLDAGHMSAVGRGALMDWFFRETQDTSVGFGDSTSPWHYPKNEIIACNVRTGEVRRLAHHYSRYNSGMYWSQPRVSTSWDGSFVMWLSNYGDNSPSDYCDMYGINSPLAETSDDEGAMNADGASTMLMVGASTAASAASQAGSSTLIMTPLATAFAEFSMGGEADVQMLGEGGSAVEAEGCYDLYLRSDVDRGNTPLSYDLNLNDCLGKQPPTEGAFSSDGSGAMVMEGVPYVYGAVSMVGSSAIQLEGGPFVGGDFLMDGSSDMQMVSDGSGGTIEIGDFSMAGFSTMAMVGAGGLINPTTPTGGRRPHRSNRWIEERDKRRKIIQQEDEELLVLIQQHAQQLIGLH